MKLGILIVALMTLMAMPFVLGAGTQTPSCYFTGAGSTNASSTSENVSIMFQVTANINMTNITITLSPAPNGNSSIYYNALGTSTNLSTPVFTISNVPDSFYTITGTPKFMNYSDGSSADMWNLTAFSATCSGTWNIDSSEGSSKVTVSAVAVATQQKKSDTALIGIIVALVLLIIWVKRK